MSVYPLTEMESNGKSRLRHQGILPVEGDTLENINYPPAHSKPHQHHHICTQIFTDFPRQPSLNRPKSRISQSPQQSEDNRPGLGAKVGGELPIGRALFQVTDSIVIDSVLEAIRFWSSLRERSPKTNLRTAKIFLPPQLLGNVKFW
jgi:hypothetical protein